MTKKTPAPSTNRFDDREKALRENLRRRKLPPTQKPSPSQQKELKK